MSTMHTEILVIGGGPAGLSAALTLSRARRDVVVLDSGEPRNAPAQRAHGLLGLEGIRPLDLLARGREEVTSYGGRIIHDRVAHAQADDGAFQVEAESGRRIQAGTLLIATGTRDILPDLPGLAERWGRDVIHCPYCHGWEIRDQRIGVLATGPMSAMQALMFGQWSPQVQFYPQGLDYPADQLAKLTATGITIADRRVTGLAVQGDALTGVVLDDTRVNPLDALVVPATTRARLDGLDGLGLQIEESEAATTLVADAAGHTSVPGVWAAGNVVNPAMQISEAAASGARVAMTLNTELIFQHAENKTQESVS